MIPFNFSLVIHPSLLYTHALTLTLTLTPQTASNRVESCMLSSFPSPSPHLSNLYFLNTPVPPFPPSKSRSHFLSFVPLLPCNRQHLISSLISHLSSRTRTHSPAHPPSLSLCLSLPLACPNPQSLSNVHNHCPSSIVIRPIIQASSHQSHLISSPLVAWDLWRVQQTDL